jgi:Ni/Fe-hydrogenase subunit HybB-like protein
MIFYRSPTGTARELSIRTVRIACTTTLLFYPSGAALRQFGPDALWAELLGLFLIVVAFGCALLLAGSSIQRIVAEEESQLDEYELKLRYKSISTAYGLLAALALVLTFGGEILADVRGPAILTGDVFGGFFWLIFLYAMILPTTILAWRLEPDDGRDEVEDDE